MQSEDDLQQWLQAQPLNSPIEISGESVYLNVEAGGAELGGYLLHGYVQRQLREALLQGFSSAIEFDAGVGITPDGSLALTQWLPGVTSWQQAALPLEKLLNQLTVWRDVLNPSAVKPAAPSSTIATRSEERLRKMLSSTRA
ncbi:MAG: hypothetical protein ACXWJK_17320 [Burkholderiaceae bacterium]